LFLFYFKVVFRLNKTKTVSIKNGLLSFSATASKSSPQNRHSLSESNISRRLTDFLVSCRGRILHIQQKRGIIGAKNFSTISSYHDCGE